MTNSDALTMAALLHILRNPYAFSEDERREARLQAADELERMATYIERINELLEGDLHE